MTDVPDNVTPNAIPPAPPVQPFQPGIADQHTAAPVTPVQPAEAAQPVQPAAQVPPAYSNAAAPAGGYQAAKPAPGWYPSPDNPALEFFWDGNAWQAGSARPRSYAPAYNAGRPLPSAPAGRPGGIGLIIGGSLLAIALSAVGIAVDHSTRGGFLWFGGLILSASLMIRGWVRHGGMTSGSKAVAGILTGVAVLSVAAWGYDFFAGSTGNSPTQKVVGSCWSDPDSSGKTYVTDCSAKDATQKAVASVSTKAECPSGTIGTIYVTEDSKYLCLVTK